MFVSHCLLSMTKTCTDCTQVKNLSEFAKRRNGTQYRCRECLAFKMREHYLNNKERYISKAKESSKRLRDEVSALKESKPCTDCKITFPSYIMTFDHLDSKTKVNDIATLVTTNNRKAVFDEIAKCELVCFNCHAQRTHNRL